MLADASLARDPERIPSRVVVLSLSLCSTAGVWVASLSRSDAQLRQETLFSTLV